MLIIYSVLVGFCSYVEHSVSFVFYVYSYSVDRIIRRNSVSAFRDLLHCIYVFAFIVLCELKRFKDDCSVLVVRRSAYQFSCFIIDSKVIFLSFKKRSGIYVLGPCEGDLAVSLICIHEVKSVQVVTSFCHLNIQRTVSVIGYSHLYGVFRVIGGYSA